MENFSEDRNPRLIGAASYFRDGASYTVRDDKYSITGTEEVFEREDAAKRLFAWYKREQFDGAEATQFLKFVRAWTKRGAAKKALAGKCEILEISRDFSIR